MQIFHLTYPVKDNITIAKVVLALGFFDGVHLGHQRLIKKAKSIAQEKGLPLMVLTFDRHPSEVYAHNHHFVYIDSLEEKAAKMQKLGVDYLCILQFTETLSRTSGSDFVNNVIMALHADTVVAGFDYTYGPREVANMTNLPKFAQNRFEIVKIPKQTFAGKKIGSTEIRMAIENGNMELAYELLGSHYVMSGKVGHGERNGHKLGFPTANLMWWDKKVVPKVGVYATKTWVAGKWYDSMTSVGYNVTIDQERQLYIESNIFDFNDNIYDQLVKIKWYKYTRGEIKFAGLAELKQQLTADEEEIKDYFKQNKMK